MTARIENVSPTRASELGPKLRIIDVRQPEEFTGELGHLRGAELVPLPTLAQSAREWKRDEALLFVCRSGVRSMRAAELAAQMGFEHVFNLDGGMLALAEQKLPVER